MLFLQDMVWVHSTAISVGEDDIVTEVTMVWDKALQLENEKLALLYFAPRGSDLLKQSYAVLEGFKDPCKHQ